MTTPSITIQPVTLAGQEPAPVQRRHRVEALGLDDAVRNRRKRPFLCHIAAIQP